MLRLVVLILLTLQLVSAIVVNKRQSSDNGPAMIPTELFKPLQSVTERSVPNSFTPTVNPQQVSSYPFINSFGIDNAKRYTVTTTYSSDNSVPFQIQELKPVYTETRFENLNKPYPVVTRWSSFPEDKNVGLNSGNGYYKISAHSSYFNSETMNEPEVHTYVFDSRNGGTPQKLFPIN